MTNGNLRVIFDTNVWISFLIGKNLIKIKDYIVSGKIKIITCEQLLTELKVVTSREKLKKYFPKNRVKELIELIEVISENVSIESKHEICRDPKDNFLLVYWNSTRLSQQEY